ncbi:hypothetical protein HUJ05_001806 [Dendroctonus ponderosae]|nr:hypothetical protein HUJ05_001806 [Dendroctonus ponderosae]
MMNDIVNAKTPGGLPNFDGDSILLFVKENQAETSSFSSTANIQTEGGPFLESTYHCSAINTLTLLYSSQQITEINLVKQIDWGKNSAADLRTGAEGASKRPAFREKWQLV